MTTKLKASAKQQTKLNIIGILLIILWFAFDHYMDAGPDIFYGQYGALAIGLLTGLIATMKGRNFMIWFGVGSWFVLAALIVLLFFPKLHDAICPYCREPVSIEATVCPHCQREIKAGEMVTTNAVVTRCLYCNAKNRIQDDTCINCGKPL
jgi:hypothetical protein